jgi:hypothetical protein
MNIWLRLTLILFMVGGGFAGQSAALAAFLNHTAFQSPFTVLATSVGFLMYSLATCGGLLFVLDSRRTCLIKMTLAAQTIQISCPVGVYKFLTGIGFYILFTSGQLEPQWGRISEHLTWWINIGAAWNVAGAEGRPWTINLNLIAVLLVMFLWRTARSQYSVTHETAIQPTYWDTLRKPPLA